MSETQKRVMAAVTCIRENGGKVSFSNSLDNG